MVPGMDKEDREGLSRTHSRPAYPSASRARPSKSLPQAVGLSPRPDCNNLNIKEKPAGTGADGPPLRSCDHNQFTQFVNASERL
jgi:hypothetical protein